MQNKKVGVIMALLAIVLFIEAAMFFIQSKSNQAMDASQQQDVQNKEVHIPSEEEVAANIADHKIYAQAIEKKDASLCQNIKRSEFKKSCAQNVSDFAAYADAVTSGNQSLCEKIQDETQKNTCVSFFKNITQK